MWLLGKFVLQWETHFENLAKEDNKQTTYNNNNNNKKTRLVL